MHLTIPSAYAAHSPFWLGLQLLRRTGPLVLVHLGAAGVLLTGGSWLEWLLLPLILYGRGLVITTGYHRYFAHRSFKTTRVCQFILACLCCLNLQNGPLWWAAQHRHHHRHADDPQDVHSPVQGGFWWAHCGWLFATLEAPEWGRVRDLRRFPELVWLERFWLVPSTVVAGLCWLAGGWSMVCVDCCLSAVITLHGTFAVNSFGHLLGSRRYATRDQSRNSFLLAALTMGDGWHNNHHHYPQAAQAGFFAWECDASFRLILVLERLGLVWGVRRIPPHKLHAGLVSKGRGEPDPVTPGVSALAGRG